jgi:hypothetical protein
MAKVHEGHQDNSRAFIIVASLSKTPVSLVSLDIHGSSIPEDPSLH